MIVLGFGEILLRLATEKGERIQRVNKFNSNYGGGEANVLISLAHFGIETKMLTAISNNEIGRGIREYLNSFNIDTTFVGEKEKRTGIYFLEVGSGNRNSKVVYDRCDTAFSNMGIDDIDIDEVLKGVDMIHFSGITLALSPSVRKLAIKLLEKCKEKNIMVSYDSNYRAKLWTLEEARAWTLRVLPYINIFSAGILDAENILGLESDIEDREKKLKYYYEEIINKYKNIKHIYSSERIVESATVNRLKCNYYTQGKIYTSKEYEISDIVDRVGGGDALTAGILYGIIKEYNG